MSSSFLVELLILCGDAFYLIFYYCPAIITEIRLCIMQKKHRGNRRHKCPDREKDF